MNPIRFSRAAVFACSILVGACSGEEGSNNSGGTSGSAGSGGTSGSAGAGGASGSAGAGGASGSAGAGGASGSAGSGGASGAAGSGGGSGAAGSAGSAGSGGSGGTSVYASDCLNRPSVSTISGTFGSQYNDAPSSGSTVDARNAKWSMVDGWLATPKASDDVCWVGGTIELTMDDTAMSPTAAWADVWHHNGGWTLKNGNAGWIFDGVTVRHVGDAFNISTTGEDFTIRHSYITDIRDDCVQNDEMYGGHVHDNFFDGCYVGFSARASGVAVDGHINTWTIEKNLVWIRPMYSVFKGDSPGNGQIIKWEKSLPQNAPHLVFTNNFVRVGKTPFQVGTSQGEAFFFPPDVEFSDNTLFWDSSEAVPSSLQQWFNAAHNSRIVTSDVEWNAAVKAWRAAHPSLH